MRQSKYGPCGLYCGACAAEDCDGCLSDWIDDSIRNCYFRRCTREKHIDFCCDCEDFPCNKLLEFMHDKWPHHWTIAPNLQYIKENGVGKWFEIQKKEWSCEHCGASILWYQKLCSCGNQLNAWEVPA